MDSTSAPGDLPIFTLPRRGGEEAWVPGQWNRDAPPVHQIYVQPVVINADISHPNVRRDFSGRIHAMPPAMPSDFAVLDEPPQPDREPRTPSCVRSTPAPTTISRMPQPCPPAHAEVRWAHG